MTAIIIISFIQAPFYENDFFRYFADGVHFLESNPVYELAPISSALKDLYPSVFSQIGFPDVKTVYPPLAILVFSIFVFLSKKNFSVFLYSLKLSVIFILVFSGFILFKEKRVEVDQIKRKQSGFGKKALLCAIMLSHPMIQIEFLINMHFDFLILFFSAYFLIKKPRQIINFFFWGASYKTILALPLVFNLKNAFKKNVLKSEVRLFVLLILILTITLFRMGNDLKFYIPNFLYASRLWEMNPGIFRWTRQLLAYSDLLSSDDILIQFSQGICLGFYFFIIYFLRRNSKKLRLNKNEFFFLQIFMLPLFTPVCNPWYFTWSMPLLLVNRESPRTKWFLLSYAPLLFYYLFYILNSGFTDEPGLWLDLEHILIFLFLYLGIRNQHKQYKHNQYKQIINRFLSH